MFQFLYSGVKVKVKEENKTIEFDLEDHSKSLSVGLKKINFQAANMGVSASYMKQTNNKTES
jgi:hypothetical protein